jgi:hypothetical protein
VIGAGVCFSALVALVDFDHQLAIVLSKSFDDGIEAQLIMFILGLQLWGDDALRPSEGLSCHLCARVGVLIMSWAV